MTTDTLKKTRAPMRKTRGKPTAVDIHVGARMRQRRQEMGLSQEKLAEALDLTFQQVQKYERGTNRVGASRLLQVANALGVEVGWFFQGLDTPAASGPTLSRLAIRVARDVDSLPAHMRQRFADLVKSVAALSSEELAAEACSVVAE